MKKEWVLTQEAFDGLLDWLDADHEQAGRKYEAIRLRLIKIFTCRGCGDAEDLADETINRVSAKIEELAQTYRGNPALYFYGVAQKVHLEFLRNKHPLELTQEDLRSVAVASSEPALLNDIEGEYECLEWCMDRLPAENRDLVLQYYQLERQAKIRHRKRLASELGIALNALRIRAHRIRSTLQQCVEGCIEQRPAH
jgi:DNA-directed RNA polymerase specialized sigma24 family protein